MSDLSPSQLLDKIIIRVPDGMRERIKRAADANGRSVNAELLVLLDKTYPAVSLLETLVEEIAGVVKNLPVENRDEAWRTVFENLEAARKETP
jgi:hypothetical protein